MTSKEITWTSLRGNIQYEVLANEPVTNQFTVKMRVKVQDEPITGVGTSVDSAMLVALTKASNLYKKLDSVRRSEECLSK